MASQQNIQRYRIVWTISENSCDEKNILSYNFTVGDSKWLIRMLRKAFCNEVGENFCSYSFFLCRPANDDTEVLQTSYYLLSSKMNQRLKNISKFETHPSLHIKRSRDNILVCSFEVISEAASDHNSGNWLEGRTEEIDLIFLNPTIERQRLHVNYVYTNQVHSIISEIKPKIVLILSHKPSDPLVVRLHVSSGLNKGEFFPIKLFDSNKEYVKICVGPVETEHKISFIKGQTITIAYKLSEFTEMDKTRISEIAKIIENEFSDSILNSEKSRSSTELPSVNTSTSVDKDLKTPPEYNISSSSPFSTMSAAIELVFKCFIDKRFCDVTIQVADGHNILAHKNILFSRSTVWQQLLTEDEHLSIIKVTEFDVATIEALLTFIYIGTVPDTLKSMDQLLVAAKTYGVEDLKSWCEQQLMDTINMDTAVNLLVLAHRYNAHELFENVLAFVRKHLTELKLREEWKSLFFQFPELTFELFNNLL